MRYLDFTEAFSLYKEGKAIRRSAWPRQLVFGTGLEKTEREILWGCSSIPHEYFAKEVIDGEDLLANDWHEVEFKRRESATRIVS